MLFYKLLSLPKRWIAQRRMLKGWTKRYPKLDLSWHVEGDLLSICMGRHGLVWRGDFWTVSALDLDKIISRHDTVCGCSDARVPDGHFEGILR